MSYIRHAHQTALTNDPSKDVSATHWNADHDISLSASDVGLGNVTNDVQTKAAVMPNTAPAAGAIPVGNAGGTAYAPVAMSGDGAIDSTGALTLQNTAAARTHLGLDTNPELIWASAVSAVSLGNDSAAHSIFAAANDALTVAANTTYIIEGIIRVTTGNTTHTCAFGLGGTATYTSVGYDLQSNVGNAGAINTGISAIWATAATATIFNATSTSQGTTLRVRGMIRTANAGTVIPQWTFSADPTGTCQVEPNSYLTFRRVGADTLASNGAWA